MASKTEYKKINEKLINILNDLLSTGDWQASLFLRTAQKKIESIYQQAVALSEEFDRENTRSASDEHAVRTRQGYIKIYVSLYQSDPHNLVKWENTLRSIKEYSINRPIYRFEEHIQEMIRAKHGSSNEGYVVIYVEPTDIIPAYAGKIIQDRFGHELLTLRDNSLQPKNIIEFVHQGRRYFYKESKLLLKSETR